MKRGITSFLLFWLLIGQLACAGSPLYYSAEAIEAQVVDAETGKPIEGVVVTANWQLYHSTVGGRVPGSQLMVMEAVTDKDGRFAFAVWGPKLALRGYLDNHDPQLLLFKSGYEYRRLTNEVSSKTNHNSVRRSQWDAKTIEMKKFKGTTEEWFKMLERVVPPYDKPEDAKQSLMLKAILAEENTIPDSIERKPLFFNNIVRRLLEDR